MPRFFVLSLLALAACPSTTGKPTGSDTRDTSSAETGADTDTGPAVEVYATLEVVTGTAFSVARRDQIYDMVGLPSAGEGCVAAGDPYDTSFAGAVYAVCPGAVALPDDAGATWTGTGTNQALGCAVHVSALDDGSEVIGTSEFHDPTYEGRALLWPASSPSGMAADVALLDIVGDVVGDGNTGGYLGTATVRSGDLILISQTNASPSIMAVEVSAIPGATFDDLFTVAAGGDGVSDGGEGFTDYSISTGAEGAAAASYDAEIQHVGLDGVPDWWADETSAGTGEYTFPADRDVTRWTRTRRLQDGSVVLSVFSRELREAGEYSYARIFDPTTGEEIDDISNVFGIADGEIDGQSWTAYGVTLCDPAYPSAALTPDEPAPPSVLPWMDRGLPGFMRQSAEGGCRAGYVHVVTEGGQEIDVSLPFEAGTFPAGGCLLDLVSTGPASFAWYCKDRPYAGFYSLVVSE